MEPLRIGHHTLTVEHPHPLRIAAVLDSFTDREDRLFALCSYLGFCLRGEAKPPHRMEREPFASYGQRVYDHLTGIGATHYEILKMGDDALAEGLGKIPRPPTREEVAGLGESSTPVDSGTG